MQRRWNLCPESSRVRMSANGSYSSRREPLFAEGGYDNVSVRAVARAAASTRPVRWTWGAGLGPSPKSFSTRFRVAPLARVNLSANMADRAAERLGGRAEVVVGDAERLPFHDGSFDAVYCNDSFHHCPDPIRATFQFGACCAQATPSSLATSGNRHPRAPS